MPDKKITFAVVGAGGRGFHSYGKYVREHSDQAQIVAVAEPRDYYRNEMARQHDIKSENVFDNWEDLLNRPRLADAIMITTPDRLHVDPAVRAANKGYHILLEKPMAPLPEECIQIVESARKNNVILAVCHVMRYTPVYMKIKEIIDSGVLGDLCTIQQLEGVGWWHQAHSFVRGNWRNSKDSSPMLLQKSCHDIDILRWWIGKKCLSVASFGQLKHFRKECKPPEAASRCMDCPLADEKCAYSAKKFYFDKLHGNEHDWPLDVLVHEFTDEALEKALREGPYGRCVYQCDNDVVDHQVVIMEFEDKITVDFTMTAFTPAGRQIRIMGTAGYLEASDDLIRTLDFTADKWTEYKVADLPGAGTDGHGGGDDGLMAAFVGAVRAGDETLISTGPEVSLESHLIVFAAERARCEKRLVCLEEMYTQSGNA